MKKTVILFGIIAISGLGLSIYNFYVNKPVLYIDALKSFNSFELTVELQEKTETRTKQYDVQLDSLKLAITLIASNEQDKYQRLVYQYQELEKAKNNDVGTLITESDNKIWDLLNSYFMEYGENKNCEILLGGMGNGNVLYVDEEKNVTSEFIDFANAKYNGE